MSRVTEEISTIYRIVPKSVIKNLNLNLISHQILFKPNFMGETLSPKKTTTIF